LKAKKITVIFTSIADDIAHLSPEDMEQAGWFKKDKEALNNLMNLNKKLLHFYNQNNSWCYFTTFEKMFDKNNIKNIFTFIDCGENFDESKVDDILKNNIKD
jgi:hypothetical protein